MVKIGDKVQSKLTGKVYVVGTFSDRYKTIAINYVRDNSENFEVISGGGANG